MGVRKKLRKSKAQKYSVRVKTGSKKKNSKVAVLPYSKKTLIQNYKTLGIDLNPNATIANEFEEEDVAQQTLEDTETVDASYLQQLVKKSATPKSQKAKKEQLPIEEYLALQKLVKKYGQTNVEKMEKDRKLNKLSWTESQISKKLRIFNKQQEEEQNRWIIND